MPSKQEPKQPSRFEQGGRYRIIHYPTEKVYDITVLERRGSWVTILLGGKYVEARVYPVTCPLSESILLGDYSAVYSYNPLRPHKGSRAMTEK